MDYGIRRGDKGVTITPARLQAFDHLPDPMDVLARMTNNWTSMPVAALGTEGDKDSRRYVAEFTQDAFVMSRSVGDHRMKLATIARAVELQGLPRAISPDPHEYDLRHEDDGIHAHENRDPELDDIARDFIATRNWRFPSYDTHYASILFAVELTREALVDSSILRERSRQRDGVVRTWGSALRRTNSWLASRHDSQHGLMFSERAIFYYPDGQVYVGAYPNWRDSRDGSVRRDGSMATRPASFIEHEAELFDLDVALADLTSDLGPSQVTGLTENQLLDRANRRRDAVIDKMLLNDDRGAFFALGVERHGSRVEPMAVRSSSPIHLLNSQMLLSSEYRSLVETLVESMFDPRHGLMTTAGVRTLGVHERAFRPGGYHTGQVWLWEQHALAKGLRMHGFDALAHVIDTAVIESCRSLKHYPEFVRGENVFPPTENRDIVTLTTRDPAFGKRHTTAAQPPQLLQGWTVAAYVGAMRALEHQAERPAATSKLEGRMLALHSRLLATALDRGRSTHTATPGRSLA